MKSLHIDEPWITLFKGQGWESAPALEASWP